VTRTHKTEALLEGLRGKQEIHWRVKAISADRATWAAEKSLLLYDP
jgi:hypothetical protein